MSINKLKLVKSFLAASLISFSIVGVAQANVQLSAAIGGEILKQFKTGKLKINQIIVEKPNIFPEEELKQLLVKYEGREISVDELKSLQSTLSKYYFETGYVNSGVIIPNQSIENGVIKFQPVHGRLTRVKISGNAEVSNKYIYNKIKKGIDVPLNATALQQSLIGLRQDPLISDVKAHIVPGDELGQSILQLTIKEGRPYYLNASTNNHKSTSIGQYGVELVGGHRNLSGSQDTLEASFAKTEGLTDFGLNYSLPIAYEDITLSANLNYNKFEVVESKFKGIESNSLNYGLGVNYPFINNSQFEVSGRMGFEVRDMTFIMFGQTSSLSNEGDQSSPLVFGVDAIVRRARFAAALSAGLRQGMNLGLIDSDNTATSFSTGVGQLYFAFRPVPRVEWAVRLNGQLANDALPSVEKFAVGGAKSVRGYRENIFVQDSGIIASTQAKIPVYRNKVFAVPFLDYGRSWNRTDGLVASGAQDIMSIGAGMQWNVSKAFYTELFWGQPLLDVDTVDDIQQSGGFHFLLNYKIY